MCGPKAGRNAKPAHGIALIAFQTLNVGEIMSCNHSKAITAFQEAKDIGALHKLLTKIMDKFPSAVADSWEEVDLAGHRCPVCKKTGIIAYDVGYKCQRCATIFLKR